MLRQDQAVVAGPRRERGSDVGEERLPRALAQSSDGSGDIARLWLLMGKV